MTDPYHTQTPRPDIATPPENVHYFYNGWAYETHDDFDGDRKYTEHYATKGGDVVQLDVSASVDKIGLQAFVNMVDGMGE